jgi:hypothetical protein
MIQEILPSLYLFSLISPLDISGGRHPPLQFLNAQNMPAETEIFCGISSVAKYGHHTQGALLLLRIIYYFCNMFWSPQQTQTGILR